MARVVGGECEHAGFLVLRTPLLAFDELAGWGRSEDMASALATARARLSRLVQEPAVREALYLASPGLYESLSIWRDQPSTERGRKVERSLVRYISRMATRPTPFGTLAGCTVGGIGPAAKLALPARAKYTRHTRIDSEYLCGLIDALERDTTIRPLLRWHSNSSLYRVGDRLHLAEWKTGEQGRTYQLVAVDRTEYLDLALMRAASAATISEIAGALTEADAEITLEDAAEFVNELIESQILVSELELCLTGDGPLPALLDRLQNDPAAHNSADVLAAARDLCGDLDRAGVGANADAYVRIATTLDDLPVKVDPARMVQVDLFKPAPGLALGKNVVDEVRRGVQVLRRTMRDGADRMAKFREAFVNRYEQQSVPLTTVLDEEAGIGFDTSSTPATDASPLLAGIAFAELEADAKVVWGRREAHLYRRLCDLLASGGDELTLTEDDIRAMENPRALPLPDSFAAMVRLAAASDEAANSGNFRVCIDLASGPSGAVLLGRFCHGEPRLAELLRDHLKCEEARRPDAIFAEIVHLPEGRLGNVIIRPLLREYEIPYQGGSGADRERQIPIGDLHVSVENERVVLRSARLGREILPRLSSAHNYMRRSLGLYRFLCALQSQGCAGGLIWTWGALEGAPFLPRVVVGRTVLSRARWLLGKREIEQLANARPGDWWAETRAWRAKRRVPRYVVLSEEDNELFVDFEQPASVGMWLHQIAGQDAALLLEMFPPPDELAVHGPEGRFTNEFVIPFLGGSPAATDSLPEIHPPTAAMPVSAGCAREFSPGSEWLYAKVYCGPAGADRVLREVVRPLVVKADALCDRWFFVRYNDPDWHVRLRLHGDPQSLTRAVIPRLHELLVPLAKNGIVVRWNLDTYQREVERYGGPLGMEMCEELFCADSAAALEIVEATEGNEGGEARWQLALRGCHTWLSDLGFDPAGRRDVARRISTAFAAEFRVDSALRKQIGEKYRNQRQRIESLVCDGWSADHPLAEGFEILARRSAAAQPTARRLLAAAKSSKLNISLPDLAASLLHMHVNRLLRAAHRAQELVLYCFLDRAYESQRATEGRRQS